MPLYGAANAAIPGGQATWASVIDLPPALDGIEESLPAYPPGFYAALCRAIFVCGSLFFDGTRAGGTYGPAWIVLAANPIAGVGGIRETARLGVHHEFSSLVLGRLPSLPARWLALLPAGWQPVLSTEAALTWS